MSNGDGTQAPEDPAQNFADPLAGLASSGPPEFAVKADIPAPAGGPDREKIRGMVDAELEKEGAAAAAADDEDANATTGEVPVINEPLPDPGQPPGVYPAQQRTWPARSQLLPQMLRRTRTGGSRAGRPKERTPPPRPKPSLPKPSNGSTGVIIAIVLLLVFTFVAIEFVITFVDSIASIFN